MKLSDELLARAMRLMPQNAAKLVANATFAPVFTGNDRFVYCKEYFQEDKKLSVYTEVSLSTGEQRELPDYTPPVPETDCVRSPDGSRAAFVRDCNLFVRDCASGAERQLTFDGCLHNAYASRSEGDTEFVRDTIAGKVPMPYVIWSPDSRRLFAHRLDERAVKELHLLQNVPEDGLRPRLYTYRYAFAGDEQVPQCHYYVIDTDTAESRPVQIPPDESGETPSYASSPKAEWISNDELLCLRMQRDFLRAEVYFVCAQTGEATLFFAEESDSFLFFDRQSGEHYTPETPAWQKKLFRWSPSRQCLYWLSERDGWFHLWAHPRTGEPRLLTPGDYQVRELLYLDEAAGKLYVTASGREVNTLVYNRYLYSVDLEKGELTLLSRCKGDHTVYFSPDGAYYTDTASSCDEPQTTTLWRTADITPVAEVCTTDAERLYEAGLTFPIPFCEKAADGVTDIYGVFIMPAGFDGTKKYPVVDYYYGGNQMCNVPASFADYALGRSFAAPLSQLELVTVILDGRGTPHRSRAFHADCFRNIGSCAGLDDHEAVLRALCEKYAFMDGERIGVWGHSGGGFATLHCMTRKPDLYKVGVATGGNHLQEMYSAGWGERFMGGFDAAAFAAQRADLLAHNLRGKLLLMHGELDDNVHPANTMRVADALMRADKDFDFLLFPNHYHTLRETPYYQRRVITYLYENLYA